MSPLPECQSGNAPSRSEWGRVASRDLGAQRKAKAKADGRRGLAIYFLFTANEKY